MPLPRLEESLEAELKSMEKLMGYADDHVAQISLPALKALIRDVDLCENNLSSLYPSYINKLKEIGAVTESEQHDLKWATLQAVIHARKQRIRDAFIVLGAHSHPEMDNFSLVGVGQVDNRARSSIF